MAVKKRGRGKRWAGGYIRHEADGSAVFIIERQVGGQRFHVSTRCHDEKAATAQLARFEANPAGYNPAGEAPEAGLLLTVELIDEFHVWHLASGTTRKHARSAARMLGQWMVAFGSRDLRRLELPELKAALARWSTSRQHRIIALKVFFKWLRQEKGLLRHAQDPTLDLPVPQGSPEKHRRRKATDWNLVREAFPYLSPRMQDVLQFFSATGWHVSEVERFVRNPQAHIDTPGVEVSGPGGVVLGVLVNWHKTKKWTRTSIVHQAHLDAIRRLKDAGTLPRKMNEQVRAAVEKADAKRREFDPTWKDREPFTVGVMRHSVATWGVELGATAEEAAAHLDHADKRTTERFYLDLRVPKPAIPTRVLQ